MQSIPQPDGLSGVQLPYCADPVIRRPDHGVSSCQYLIGIQRCGKGGSVVINAVPAAQSVKGGKVGALRELTQDELSAYLNDSAVQKSHSNRFDSSYLLCKEKDGSTIVVWYESEADIAEKTELCKLLGIKNVYVLK